MGTSNGGVPAGMQSPPWAGGGRPAGNMQGFSQMLGAMAWPSGVGGALGMWAQALGLKASPQLQQAYSQMPWAKGLIGGGVYPANFTGGAHGAVGAAVGPFGNPPQQPFSNTSGSHGLTPSDLMTAGANGVQGGGIVPPWAMARKFGQQS